VTARKALNNSVIARSVPLAASEAWRDVAIQRPLISLAFWIASRRASLAVAMTACFPVTPTENHTARKVVGSKPARITVS